MRKVVNEVTHLKQDITSIKRARQQLQQQTGMMAELRYEHMHILTTVAQSSKVGRPA